MAKEKGNVAVISSDTIFGISGFASLGRDLDNLPIEQRIRIQVLKDSIQVEAIEFGEKSEVKIKMTELGLSTYVVKCTNSLSMEFAGAYMKLKPHVDFFKQYNLPYERDLIVKFEQEKIASIKKLKGAFDERAEEKLKYKILAEASVEKIFIRKIELKSLIEGDSTIEYYQLTVQTINPRTGFPEEDQLCFNKREMPKDNPEFKSHKQLLDCIDQVYYEAKLHLREFYAYKESLYQKRYNRYMIEASQGNLFKDITTFDKKYLQDKVVQLKLNEKMDELLDENSEDDVL